MQTQSETSVPSITQFSASAEKALYVGEAFREAVEAGSFFTEFLFIGLAEKQLGVADALLKANNINRGMQKFHPNVIFSSKI